MLTGFFFDNGVYEKGGIFRYFNNHYYFLSRMKRLLLTIALFCSLLCVAHAQDADDFVSKTYIRAGGGGTSFHGSDDVIVMTGFNDVQVLASRIPAWSLAVGKQWGLASGGFYAGAEASIGNSGCVYDSDLCDYPVPEEDACYLRYDFTHLQLMPMVGECAPLSRNVDFDIHVGLFGSCNLKNSCTQRLYGSLETTEPLDMRSFRRLDAGLAGGFGFWFYDRINVDFLYQYGLVKRSDFWGKTSTCLIRLGYAF